MNPPNALRCDCGYDFATRVMKDSYLGPTYSSHSVIIKLKKWRKIFTLVFIVSFGILFIFTPIALHSLIDWGMGSDRGSGLINILAILIFAASLIVSVTSLVGVVFSTALAWYKEKRERRDFDLDNQKKELEIEKMKAACR